MTDTPSALSARLSTRLSGTKRPRESLIEFRVKDIMESLGVSEDYLVLGIDEAGRGPVIGPMVYTGAVISLGEHDDLVRLCHVADSKMLNERRRLASLQQLRQLKTFRSFTVCVSPEEISKTMTGRSGRNSNTLSHETAIQIISEATLASAGKLCAAYVDTVGPPETYQARLAGRFPHLRVTVAKKADSIFPIVSAASIVAKTVRDTAIEALGENIGSGYPSDPRTMEWLRSHVHRFFSFPHAYDFARHSWGPLVQLANDPAVRVPVVCEQDLEGARQQGRGGDSRQQKLSFAKPSPKRHMV
ncbi:putative ribonuclease H [Leishmania major strain Friedlin]|uniref:Ribonuclease n=1 Tax=Leishmania major TaxID=5664 RepID=Q8ISS8_LEIMA|nr:putative ribonuclease H [Leishmania major strain Friedlin]AAN34793.1 ribonuclease H(35) [Leishmania major]AAW23359.1 ribonuclease HIIB [Leishmania major]CAG9583582.1 ribonuclease_H_-_putative [Leishmania major strain Friedlin]CAJ09017.1 putative ribonuclease H [Leishmania major strain Friedlin]|eukprot:XP_001686636.1 putative ribonuclease H [Leishmania major strain Friedlin]